ncbi:MAG: molybdopterin-dependent oxidoreductase [Chloroflexi bacterium]|nr:molybdopterin-dependent oxidoreductase [Chloroflexota bacterium]
MATITDPRVSRKAAFGIGTSAAAAMSLLLLALRFAFDAQIVTEVMADWLTRLLPPQAFDFFLERLQFGAKPLLFVMILVGQVGAGGGIGLLYRRFAPAAGSEGVPLRISLAMAIALWLILGLLLTPLMGGGPFGVSLPGPRWGYAASLILATATYAVLLVQAYHLVAATGGAAPNRGRRELLRFGVLAGVVIIGGGLVLRTILNNLGNLSLPRAFRTAGVLPPEVTPNEDFYVIAKSPFTPSINVEKWRLEVGGSVGNPYSLTYAELRDLPSIEEYVTLTCISNPIGGDLISNALWKGVPLRLLLDRAQLPGGVERLAFHAADGYVDSFPIEVAMRENVIVAYEMNGVELPREHGFPARIIVPGLYGMEHVKWLTKIEPVPASFRGYWQRRGWADTAVINSLSRVDVPMPGAQPIKDELLLGGVAFAGDRGIRSVEVSVDGQTWVPARLRDALSPYTWVIWTSEWAPPAPGAYTIQVRAIDGTGQIQTSEIRGNLPSGATGYDTLIVRLQDEAAV